MLSTSVESSPIQWSPVLCRIQLTVQWSPDFYQDVVKSQYTYSEVQWNPVECSEVQVDYMGDSKILPGWPVTDVKVGALL